MRDPSREPAPDRGRTSVLVLSVPAGHGHRRPADALVAAARRNRPDVRCTHRDELAMANRLVPPAYAAVHRAMMDRSPATVGRVYRRIERAYARPRGGNSSRWVRLVGGRRLADRLREAAPDVVVATHCLAAELVSRLLAAGRLRCRLWVVENDFSFHSWWRHPHVDGYVVPSEDVAWGLRRQGVDAGRIHVLGVPVMPGFGEPPSRVAAAAGLGIDPERFTVLLMSGGAGVGRMGALAAALLAVEGGIQVVALAGAGRPPRDRLERLAAEHPGRLLVLPFTDRVEVPMAAADVVVTKPGGSTIAECLALGAATVLVRPTPGMEDRNAAWLLERGAALLAHDDAGLGVRVERLRRDADARARLAAAARALGRPRAASDALELILRDQ